MAGQNDQNGCFGQNGQNDPKGLVFALRAQASAAQRSEESRLSGKNRRASREEKPVAQ